MFTFEESLIERIDRLEPDIRALLPERVPVSVSAPGPLAGVPVVVKDIFHVDGFPTRAGSAVPVPAGLEASCIARLRTRGALILAKSVTTEFAMLAPGATRNPRNLAHTPGGSSSGSAAAVAAGYCPLALGTQTVGSTIRPAAFCGVVGFKPSFGRVPLDGVIPVSPSADTIGLFTSNLGDLALAASVIVRQWRAAAIDGAPRVAVPAGPYLDVAEELAMLEGMRRVPAFDDWERIQQCHWDVVLAEFAESHREWFPRYASMYRPGTARLLDRGRAVAPAAVEAGRASMGALRERLHALMDAEGIDVWASPAAAGSAPEGLEATGSPLPQLPWTHAGMPALTIPAGTAPNGLPLGLQLVARFGEDEKLLAWARYLDDT